MERTVRLDSLDIKIIIRLQQEARITNQDLADAVGLSPSACLQRVRRLEQQGVIGRYCARVNLDRVCRSIIVIATVTLKSHGQADFAQFEAAIRELPEVVECLKVSGPFDYFLRFACSDVARYHALSETLLHEGPGVSKLSSYVVLDQTKEFAGYPIARLIEG